MHQRHWKILSFNMTLLSISLKRLTPLRSLRAAMSTSVKKSKLEYFEEQLKDGWNPKGVFKALHLLIPHRQSFIMDEVGRKGVVKVGTRPLDGLKVLDVGCGHGLMTEAMAACGADVIGIDPADKLIQIAKEHAHTHSPSLLPRLQYYTTTAEEHVLNNTEQYDVIMAFLVLEHVAGPKDFLKNCINMLKKDGSIFILHGNKTWLLYLWILLWQVHATKLTPKAVATYSNLISTNDIVDVLKNSGCILVNTQGINANFRGDGYHKTKSSRYANLIHAFKS